MERLELSIGGMTCGHCVGAVTRALRQVEGVTVEAVEVGSAKVSYDPAVASPERIAEAVAEEGYEVRGGGRPS